MIKYHALFTLILNLELKNGCGNNPEYSSAPKIGEHIPCGYLISLICTLDHIENKHTLYCRKYCIKKFCEFLSEHTKNLIDFEKKKMLPLTIAELKSHQDAKVCYICGKRILKKLSKIQIIRSKILLLLQR